MRVLTRTTSIRLPGVTHQELMQIADRVRVPPSQLMRSAICQLINDYRKSANKPETEVSKCQVQY